jgi:hypothetical protein
MMNALRESKKATTKLVRVTGKPGLFTFESIERDLDLEQNFSDFIYEEEKKEKEKTTSGKGPKE